MNQTLFSLTPPRADDIARLRASLKDAPYHYDDPGATRLFTPPRGYDADHNRRLLGHGAATFEKAKAAIRSWRMFHMPWVTLHDTSAPIIAGEVVCVVFNVMKLWAMNFNRIVYVVEDQGELERFGFAYGTLTHHAESGEERFLVEWNHADDTVHYDLAAYSRPNHILTKLGYPIARHYQKKFVTTSLAAMAEFCR